MVLNALEDAYRRIGARFAYYPLERLEVILYPDEAFREITNTPHWSGAVYDGRIKLPIGGLQRGSERLARTLRHEYAHAAIVTLSRGKAPLWLNEGLAQVSEETDDPGRTGRLRLALANEGLLPLTDLEAGFTKLQPRAGEPRVRRGARGGRVPAREEGRLQRAPAAGGDGDRGRHRRGLPPGPRNLLRGFRAALPRRPRAPVALKRRPPPVSSPDLRAPLAILP